MQDMIKAILKNIEQSLWNVEQNTSRMCSSSRNQEEIALENPIPGGDRVKGTSKRSQLYEETNSASI